MARPKTLDRQWAVRLTPEQTTQIAALAARRRCSVAELLRAAVAEYLAATPRARGGHLKAAG